MALAYLLDPSFQFVNENGRPLVGGHIEVYYHNSHLPYVTKSDFDGTNNPFEVPLNSKGMAVIIADDSNAYDVFCHDALGALFWSRENVTIGAGGGGGGGESKLEIFNCTEPDWPNPTEMFDSYNGGKDVVIVRQSFSGVNYSVWSLENVVKDSGLVKNYTLEFQNEEGTESANHKTNRVSFYSSDYENWTITEKTFYYPERSTIAPNWSSLDVSNYKKGTLVYRAGVLYICKTDTPSSSWVASEWEETNIASEVEKGKLKIFTCTEPDWPEPSLMYSAFESGQDIAIVRQSFSGVIYSVWRLATTIKDVGSPKNYTLEFQNDEGSETANRKTNRVKFYSTDKENWTTTETNFVYPERATIASNWSSLDVSNYKKGTLVYRAGVLYRCKTDTPSSSWVASEWEETDIANEIEYIISGKLAKDGWVDVSDQIEAMPNVTVSSKSFFINKALGLYRFGLKAYTDTLGSNVIELVKINYSGFVRSSGIAMALGPNDSQLNTPIPFGVYDDDFVGHEHRIVVWPSSSNQAAGATGISGFGILK